MKCIFKISLLSMFNALLLTLARCFDNDIWRVSIVIFMYSFSFFIVMKPKKIKFDKNRNVIDTGGE